MEKIAKKGMAALVGIALVSAAGLAQAETRFAVQDAAGTTDKMVVTDGGRIGVGNAAPNAGIHIKAANYPDNTLKVEGAGGGGIIAYTQYTPLAFPTIGARLGYQYFGAINSTVEPPTAIHSTGFFAGADANWSSTSTPSFFAFETTAPGSTIRTERMRVASSGYVGIGTTLPTQKLEVRDGGLRLNNAAVQPACNNSTAPNLRGTFWFVKGATGQPDTLQVCARDAANYAWRTVPLQ